MLICRKTIVKVENLSPPPKRSGANNWKYTNSDLPNGAINNNTWRKKVIPTYIQYLAGLDVKETWTVGDKDSITLLQNIWNFTYGAELPHVVKVNGPVFLIVSLPILKANHSLAQADQRICEWRAGSTALAILKAFFDDNEEEYNTLIYVKHLLVTPSKTITSSMELLRRKMARYVFFLIHYIFLNAYYRLSEKIFFWPFHHPNLYSPPQCHPWSSSHYVARSA
jgi:hypothetical protein